MEIGLNSNRSDGVEYISMINDSRTEFIVNTNLSMASTVTFPVENTFNNSQWTDDGAFYEDEYHHVGLLPIVRALNQYVQPFIIVLGLCGNALVFLIYGLGYQRKQSSSVYLATIALSDSGFLLTLLGSWLETWGVPAFNTNVLCQLNIYLSYIWAFISVWSLVCFSVERFIAVFYPFKRDRVCTVRRAKIVVCVVTIVALLGYSCALWSNKVRNFGGNKNLCAPDPNWPRILQILTHVDMVMSFAIPLIAIMVLNISICVKITRFYRSQKRPMAQTRFTPGGAPQTRIILRRHTSGGSRTEDSMNNAIQMKVTIVLVVISVAFIILNLPTNVLRLVMLFSALGHRDLTLLHDGQILLQQIFQILYYTNYGINFFLYLGFSKQFRHAFTKYFKMYKERFGTCWLKLKRRRFHSRRRQSSRTSRTSVKTLTFNLTADEHLKKRNSRPSLKFRD
ncbi:unnamed protein product [Owenia fusiformis]|uniref:Uncharacterized protein n=1 Tax=Owenia fusiformis TaxID=6347 RepID=A0A8J1TUN2_OWEFU|nr:unnamed protein product [Owenia fusiformis]